MNTLDEWAAAVCAELGLDPAALDARLVLDLARDVAHGVARPAAPLTAYLLGVAAGPGTAARRVGGADQPAGLAVGSARGSPRGVSAPGPGRLREPAPAAGSRGRQPAMTHRSG